MPVRVFFSYSHADEALRDQLEKHLAVLKHEGTISTWHDRRMMPGDIIDWEIDAELNKADIILLLVSSDFLSSNYCYNIEQAKALQRSAEGTCRIMSVILRPCDWQASKIGHFLAAPKDGKPISTWPDVDEALFEVARAVRQAAHSLEKQIAPQDEAHPAMANHQAAPVAEQPAVLAPRHMLGAPRSSNLRIRKTFSEADLDKFGDEAFSYIQKFLEKSVEELHERNKDITYRLRTVDADRFTCAIYASGKKLTACTIFRGGAFGGNSISLLLGEESSSNALNESLSIHHDDQSIYLKAMGMPMLAAKTDKLSLEGAAEYYWSLLIQPLQ